MSRSRRSRARSSAGRGGRARAGETPVSRRRGLRRATEKEGPPRRAGVGTSRSLDSSGEASGSGRRGKKGFGVRSGSDPEPTPRRTVVGHRVAAVTRQPRDPAALPEAGGRDPVTPSEVSTEVAGIVHAHERHHRLDAEESALEEEFRARHAQVVKVARGWNAGFAPEEVREPGRREVDGGGEL